MTATKLNKTCDLCHAEISGKHLVSYWGDAYCLEHAKVAAGCSYCGRFVPYLTQKDQKRMVENISCDTCAAGAITEADRAKELALPLIDWVETLGVKLRQKSFKIEVLDRADFLSRKGGRHDPLGLTMSTRIIRNNKIERAIVSGVAFLQGMPHTLFSGVCVHELGHVWLVQHKILGLPMLEEEGFCELLAHHYYTGLENESGKFYAERIAKNSSPVYGDGFRKLKKLEDRVGFEQIIKSLLRKKKLPL